VTNPEVRTSTDFTIVNDHYLQLKLIFNITLSYNYSFLKT